MGDAFRQRARKHQSDYRAEILNLPYDRYESMLLGEDARKGRNFYKDYGILEAVKKRYPGSYMKQLFANMLRSEHIPFNVFVPFLTEKALFCSTVTSLIGVTPTADFDIRIEHAPEPADEYLDDKTSFDVFCDCQDQNGDRFFLGVEVKYTERGYRIGRKEQRDCNNPDSPYNRISRESGLYRPEVLEILKRNRFRQLWRNHLLAESIVLNGEAKYKDYRSIILYPLGNTHISRAVKEYRNLLVKDRADSFLGITFEEFFSLIAKHASSPRAKKWVAYLNSRYIPMVGTD